MLPPSVRIYLATDATDMRKGHDGLAALVTARGQDVYSGHLFVFLSRRRDRVKLLWFDAGGFVLWYKRLEQGRFRMPRVPPDAAAVALDAGQLAMLLDGVDLSRVRRARKWQPPTQSGPKDRHDRPIVVEAVHGRRPTHRRRPARRDGHDVAGDRRAAERHG